MRARDVCAHVPKSNNYLLRALVSRCLIFAGQFCWLFSPFTIHSLLNRPQLCRHQSVVVRHVPHRCAADFGRLFVDVLIGSPLARFSEKLQLDSVRPVLGGNARSCVPQMCVGLSAVVTKVLHAFSAHPQSSVDFVSDLPNLQTVNSYPRLFLRSKCTA